MKTEITLKFKNVPIGAQFFDPLSGEDFIKHSDHVAGIVSGGDFDHLATAQFDLFDADDEVVLEVQVEDV